MPGHLRELNPQPLVCKTEFWIRVSLASPPCVSNRVLDTAIGTEIDILWSMALNVAPQPLRTTWAE